MFDFLKKPTHHHPQIPKNDEQHSPKKVQNESPPSKKLTETINCQIVKVPKNKPQASNKKQPVTVKKYQSSNPIQLTKQVQSIFKQMLLDARQSVNDLNVNDIITKEMDSIEKRAYIRYTSVNEQNYLNSLFRGSSIANSLVRQGLNDLISGTVSNIADDIEQNKYDYEVFKKKIMTKDDLAQMETMEHMIKKKQGEISQKVGELRMQLRIVQDPVITSKAQSIIDKDSFSKDKEKAKEIQKFIQQKKLERQEIQRKKKQDQQRKALKQLQHKIAQQKQAQKAKSQRHAKLVQRYQAKQLLKQRRQQQVQSQKQKFAAFLKQYRKSKPLYQQKVEQQYKRQIEEKKFRFEKMAQRKNKYNPLNLQEIEDFQQKYLQLKRQQEQKKKIQMLIKKDQEKFRIQQMKDKHYKGKYRYLVLEEMVNRQAKKNEDQFVKKLLVQKKRAYSVDIKQKHKPKIDENKRLQSLNFIIQSQRKTKHKGPIRVKLDGNNFNTISYELEQPQPDPKKQGQKNRKLFKQYIQQKIQKGQIKRPQTFQSKISVYTPKIDYLRQKRQNRQTRNSSFSHQSLDAESRVRRIRQESNGDPMILKLKAEELDQKARRQELKLKYAEHNPNDQKELEENYLASIKSKLQLLNNVK